MVGMPRRRERGGVPGWYDQSHRWATLAAPLDSDKSSLFKRPKRPKLGPFRDTPIFEHHVRNNECVAAPQTFQVPKCQPDKQRRDAKLASLTHPNDINAGYELAPIWVRGFSGQRTALDKPELLGVQGRKSLMSRHIIYLT